MSADETAVQTEETATEKRPWQIPHEYIDNNGWCLTCGRSEASPCHAEPPAEEVADEPAADTAPLELPEDDS